jgi:hypothetical protein
MAGADLFRDIAAALGGFNAVAAALEVAPRSVERWASGTKPIPPGVWPQLQELLRLRAARCEELAVACVAESPRPSGGPPAISRCHIQSGYPAPALANAACDSLSVFGGQ